MALEIQTEALAEAVIVGQAQTASHAGKHSHVQSSCANCGATLTGPYCHNCGQAAHVHKSLLHLVEEFLHGFFHFETKAWRTIPALIFKPGKLTRNYIDGQRVRFVSPLALFLFLIFLMFFVFSLGTKHEVNRINQDPQVVQQRIDRVLENQQSKIKRLAETSDAETKEELQAELKELGTKLADLKQRQTELNQELAKNKQAPATAEAEKKTRDNQHIDTLALGFKKIKEKFDSGDLTFSSISFIDQRLRAIFERDDFNAELMAYKLKSASSKFAFVLLPITLPFIWLLFIFRRRFTLFDHAVFCLYSLSFMAILMISLRALSFLNWEAALGLSIFFVPPLHMYAHLKGTYELGRLAALWRTFAVSLIALVSLVVYGFFLLLVGL